MKLNRSFTYFDSHYDTNLSLLLETLHSFSTFLVVSHLEERNTFGLVEDEVLVDEGRLCGHALVAGDQLFLQRALHRTERTVSNKL